MILHANRAFYRDDAYMTLRYARNLIDGAGMAWNPGEHVQGYTNFLHPMLASCLGKLDLGRNGRVLEEDGLVFTYYRRMRD